MDIGTYESLINAIARRYSKDSNDLEDLEQLGRVTVWEVLEKKPDAPTKYIATAIKNDILTYISSQRAKKRSPPGGLVSLSEPLSGEDSRILEEIVGSEDTPIIPPEELSRGLIDELRKKYGRYYIAHIRLERQPRFLVRRIFRYAIEEIHRIPKEEAPKRVDYQFFVDNGLVSLLWVFYDNSPFYAVSEAFKGELLPWDFRRKPQGFWKGKRGYKRALEAVEWFTHQREIKNGRDCRYIKLEDFEELGLGGMIQRHFNSCPFLALKTKFSDLQPWQTRQTSQGFFDDESNQLDAVLNFLLSNGIPPLLELTPEETYETGIRTIVSKDSMNIVGLRGLLKRFEGSTYRLYSTLFPEQILPWTLHGSKEPWIKNPEETAANAVRWLFDDYFKIPMEEIPEYATCKLFWRVGFSGILTNKKVGFNSSPYAAVDSAYPGTFSREDFDRHRKIFTLATKKLKKDWKRS